MTEKNNSAVKIGCKNQVVLINIKEEQSCAFKLPDQSWRTPALGRSIQMSLKFHITILA